QAGLDEPLLVADGDHERDRRRARRGGDRADRGVQPGRHADLPPIIPRTFDRTAGYRGPSSRFDTASAFHLACCLSRGAGAPEASATQAPGASTASTANRPTTSMVAEDRRPEE